jgi:hypothetical protein
MEAPASGARGIVPDDEMFRALHKELVETYEQTLDRHRQEADWLAGRSDRLATRRGEVLRQVGLDMDKAEAAAAEDAAELENELDAIRQQVLEPRQDRRALGAFQAEASTAAQGRHRGLLHAATLVAPSAEQLAGNPGERGNPWVLPYNPGRVDIFDRSTGSGWGCWATASTPGAGATFWYYLVPERSGPWFFWAFTSVHGFYILRADDGYFDCKSASVELTATLDVWQYGHWHGPKEFTVLDQEGDHLNRFDRIDRGTWYEYLASVGAGDPVWVRVTFGLDAFANGGGSYAEINLSEGVGNYLEPVALIAGPWS